MEYKEIEFMGNITRGVMFAKDKITHSEDSFYFVKLVDPDIYEDNIIVALPHTKNTNFKPHTAVYGTLYMINNTIHHAIITDIIE
jgi:hypothetical protein